MMGMPAVLNKVLWLAGKLVMKQFQHNWYFFFLLFFFFSPEIVGVPGHMACKLLLHFPRTFVINVLSAGKYLLSQLYEPLHFILCEVFLTNKEF